MAVSQWFLKTGPLARLLMVLGVFGLAACDIGKEDEKAKQAAAVPPPAVVVAEVVQRTVPIYAEYVAQTDARETVEIRARVQAFLEAQHFTEGKVVKKDQLLFTLDKREYEAKLLQAKADLEVAMARLAAILQLSPSPRMGKSRPWPISSSVARSSRSSSRS